LTHHPDRWGFQRFARQRAEDRFICHVISFSVIAFVPRQSANVK